MEQITGILALPLVQMLATCGDHADPLHFCSLLASRGYVRPSLERISQYTREERDCRLSQTFLPEEAVLAALLCSLLIAEH